MAKLTEEEILDILQRKLFPEKIIGATNRVVIKKERFAKVAKHLAELINKE